MSEQPKDQRIPIMMSASEVKAIDDWGFQNRIRTRAEAVRRLVQMGLGVDRAIGPITETAEATHDQFIELIAGLKGKNFDEAAIETFQTGFREIVQAYHANQTKLGILLGELADIKDTLEPGVSDETLRKLRASRRIAEEFGRVLSLNGAERAAAMQVALEHYGSRGKR